MILDLEYYNKIMPEFIKYIYFRFLLKYNGLHLGFVIKIVKKKKTFLRKYVNSLNNNFVLKKKNNVETILSRNIIEIRMFVSETT